MSILCSFNFRTVGRVSRVVFEGVDVGGEGLENGSLGGLKCTASDCRGTRNDLRVGRRI